MFTSLSNVRSSHNSLSVNTNGIGTIPLFSTSASAISFVFSSSLFGLLSATTTRSTSLPGRSSPRDTLPNSTILFMFFNLRARLTNSFATTMCGESHAALRSSVSNLPRNGDSAFSLYAHALPTRSSRTTPAPFSSRTHRQAVAYGMPSALDMSAAVKYSSGWSRNSLAASEWYTILFTMLFIFE